MSYRGRGRAGNAYDPNVLVSQGAGREHQMPGQAVKKTETTIYFLE